MKPSDFTPRSPGQVIKTPRGYWAYVPAPLPPKIEWLPGLVNQLSRADRSLARLAEVGKSFPVPHVVTRSFVRSEAVLSSRIEGTRTSIQELYTYEARQLPLLENLDAHEVHNYVKALDYGLERLATLPVSQRLLRELHGLLMKGVRGEHAAPGEVRRSQNWIGTPGATLQNATYVPPPVEQMLTCLKDLEEFIHSPSALPPLVRVALIHYQFEAIHPFVDGNGRVGRLLISLLLGAWDLLPQPLLYLSAYFEARRQAYYDHLLAVSQKGAWEAWLEFFLAGVEQQGQNAAARVQRLADIRAQYRQFVVGKRTQDTLYKAIDFLLGQPIVTVSHLQEGIGLNNYVTAQRYTDRLIELGILHKLGGRARNRLFAAEEILRILEGN